MISERAHEWLAEALAGAVEQGLVSESEARLILSRCHGPDLYELSRANETLFHGIRDASDPWELIARGLIVLVFHEDDIERVRRAVIDAEVKRVFDLKPEEEKNDDDERSDE